MEKKRCPICDEVLFGIELNRALCDACESIVNRRARVFREGQGTTEAKDLKQNDMEDVVALRTAKNALGEDFL